MQITLSFGHKLPKFLLVTDKLTFLTLVRQKEFIIFFCKTKRLKKMVYLFKIEIMLIFFGFFIFNMEIFFIQIVNILNKASVGTILNKIC